jgi:ABC-2 type transport system ATP-binding protein
MHAISVTHLRKTFNRTCVVDDVSFHVESGEIFGLLGPNGAGKTTILRMILGIFKPDRGSVEILGGPMNSQKKERIGCIPEERGLYLDLTLERCLYYLGSLKGLSRADLRKRADDLMEQMELTSHKRKKVNELSKGMQQKAQIINAVVHKPQLLIVDEPFSGLDPINVQAIKKMMLDLRDQGTTIVMSTHQMHQVEELGDRIVLIDKGQVILHDDLNAVRRRYTGNAVVLRTAEPIPSLPGVQTQIPVKNGLKLILSDDTTPQELLNMLVSKNITVERFELACPSLEEIFVRLVKEGDA